jgi:hypothetical protein
MTRRPPLVAIASLSLIGVAYAYTATYTASDLGFRIARSVDRGLLFEINRVRQRRSLRHQRCIAAHRTREGADRQVKLKRCL